MRFISIKVACEAVRVDVPRKVQSSGGEKAWGTWHLQHGLSPEGSLGKWAAEGTRGKPRERVFRTEEAGAVPHAAGGSSKAVGLAVRRLLALLAKLPLVHVGKDCLLWVEEG